MAIVNAKQYNHGIFKRDDIVERFSDFFGAPTNPQLLSQYTDSHANNLAFPDAFVGRNEHLRDTMSNLLLQNQQDFMTASCLPWRAVEGVEVQWDRIEFNVRLLNQVPYEGVSRMQTHLRRSFRERVVRRGVGMQIESDFFLTEQGRQHFRDHLMSIRMAVQETANFDGLFAMLTTPNYAHMHAMQRGLYPTRSPMAAMRPSVSLFGIVQKEERGFDRAIEMGRTKMQSYHAQPDTLIISPELSLYVTTVPTARIDFSAAGQPGVGEFRNGGVDFGAGQKFRNLAVHQVLPFDVGDRGARTQMLERVVQTGEFFIMPKDVGAIFIFDEDTDSITKITREDAITNARTIFGEDSIPIGSKERLVILRPFMEHRMLSAIMTKAGPDTGMTLFGASGARQPASPHAHPPNPLLTVVTAHPRVRCADMQISSHTATKVRRPFPPAHPLAHSRPTAVTRCWRTVADDRGPLHLPHQVRHHEAGERAHPREHHVHWIQRRWWDRILHQQT